MALNVICAQTGFVCKYDTAAPIVHPYVDARPLRRAKYGFRTLLLPSHIACVQPLYQRATISTPNVDRLHLHASQVGASLGRLLTANVGDSVTPLR